MSEPVDKILPEASSVSGANGLLGSEIEADVDDQGNHSGEESDEYEVNDQVIQEVVFLFFFVW